jgi:hypothetical protein
MYGEHDVFKPFGSALKKVVKKLVESWNFLLNDYWCLSYLIALDSVRSYPRDDGYNTDHGNTFVNGCKVWHAGRTSRLCVRDM